MAYTVKGKVRLYKLQGESATFRERERGGTDRDLEASTRLQDLMGRCP